MSDSPVEGAVRAGYLKIVKAPIRGGERRCGTASRGGTASQKGARTLLGPERGAFKVMAFHWRCYKFICHNLLYAALLAYLYMPARGHTQIPLARVMAVGGRWNRAWSQVERGRRHCSPVERLTLLHDRSGPSTLSFR